MRPGELFGEIACLGGATRTATVRAAAESEVLELTGDAIRAELRQSPALLENILRSISERVRNISTREATVRDEQRRLRRVLEHLQPPLEPFQHHPLFLIDVRWQPLSFASGDYYDILELSSTRFLVALGDVMGHGAPTAPIVGMIRSQLHEFARADRQPHELLHHLHQHMRRHGDTNVFMTLTLLLLDFSAWTAAFSVAGPPCPLLFRAGQASSLTTEFGWTLGYPFEGITFSYRELPLQPVVKGGSTRSIRRTTLRHGHGSSQGPRTDAGVVDCHE